MLLLKNDHTLALKLSMKHLQKLGSVHCELLVKNLKNETQKTVQIFESVKTPSSKMTSRCNQCSKTICAVIIN